MQMPVAVALFPVILHGSEPRTLCQPRKGCGTRKFKSQTPAGRVRQPGYPPKIIWLRAASCSVAEIQRLLRAAQSIITRFVSQDEESCLLLGPRAKSK